MHDHNSFDGDDKLTALHPQHFQILRLIIPIPSGGFCWLWSSMKPIKPDCRGSAVAWQEDFTLESWMKEAQSCREGGDINTRPFR